MSDHQNDFQAATKVKPTPVIQILVAEIVKEPEVHGAPVSEKSRQADQASGAFEHSGI